MYCPTHFAETRAEVLRDLMRHHALATLITQSPAGLQADHIPLHWQDDGSTHGRLVGHAARANPLWRDTPAGSEVLAVFQGPQAYISPSWYATKQEAGRVVPTWNYAVVHARGPWQVVDDAPWVREQLQALTDQHEAALVGAKAAP